ncbi:MAG: hypothetical protein K0V04_25365 [Deltaproteobacteria bacterium]|nr:hypothetical protein [Deltaproteobacteria bacterium]
MLKFVALSIVPALACSKPNSQFDIDDPGGSTLGPSPAAETGRLPSGGTRGELGSGTDDVGGQDSTADVGDPSTGTAASAGSTSGLDGGSDTGGDAQAQRRVFLSSALYTGAMGGVQGADASCQALADAATLGGTWLAFLFDTTYTFDSYPQAGGPFITLDGEIVATDWLDLTDGTIASPIDRTEYGTVLTVGVWTGLFEGPGATTDNWCYGWTSAGGQCRPGQLDECGGIGLSHHTDSWWDGSPLDTCAQLNHLYCIEVAPQ